MIWKLFLHFYLATFVLVSFADETSLFKSHFTQKPTVELRLSVFASLRGKIIAHFWILIGGFFLSVQIGHHETIGQETWNLLE